MSIVDVVVSSPISRSMRCRQVEALFDVPVQEKQALRWTGKVPLDEKPWNVGLIVGPSGSGKSTVAESLFGEALAVTPQWGAPSVIDDFPESASLTDVAAICQAVGFNTIPAWLRPFSVLSNGEQFRVTLARLLAEQSQLVVMDEFTSVVDRQVAKIGSHAAQKYIRKRNTQFVAVSCHSDIVEWLNPDWILEPATMRFAWRSLQGRPAIEVDIARVDYSAWRIFAPYHYMSAELHKAAQCFGLFIGGEPAAFLAVMHRPNNSRTGLWGGSRVVTLPDYQGLGLAFVLVEAVAAALRAVGCEFSAPPAHPSFIRSFDRSPKWQLRKRPGLVATADARFGGRPNAVYRYVGPPAADKECARRFLAIPSLC